MKRRHEFLQVVLLFILITLLIYQNLISLQLPGTGLDRKLADGTRSQRQADVVQVVQTLPQQPQYDFAELAQGECIFDDVISCHVKLINNNTFATHHLTCVYMNDILAHKYCHANLMPNWLGGFQRARKSGFPSHRSRQRK